LLIKKVAYAVLLIAFTFFIAGCGANVIASVDGRIITSGQLAEETDKAKKVVEQQGIDFSGPEGQERMNILRRNVLDQMINEQVLLQQAARLGLEPSAAQVEKEIKKVHQQFDSEGKYRQFLAANDLSEPKLRDLIKKDLAIKAVQGEVLKKTGKVTEKQARSFYEQNKDKFSVPEKRQVRQILVPVRGKGSEALQKAKAQAEELISRLKRGENFEVVVREVSGTGNAVGEQYVIGPGEATTELEKAIFSLKPGEVSSVPIQSALGFHIFKLEKVIPVQVVVPFEEVKTDILNYLNGQDSEKIMNKYLLDIKNNYQIENRLSVRDK